jgi:hypothetical protein
MTTTTPYLQLMELVNGFCDLIMDHGSLPEGGFTIRSVTVGRSERGLPPWQDSLVPVDVTFVGMDENDNAYTGTAVIVHGRVANLEWEYDRPDAFGDEYIDTL